MFFHMIWYILCKYCRFVIMHSFLSFENAINWLFLGIEVMEYEIYMHKTRNPSSICSSSSNDSNGSGGCNVNYQNTILCIL